jgi:hypothetical protein
MRASLAAFQISAQLLGLGKQRVVERHGDAHGSAQSRHRLMPIPMRRIAIRALVIHAMRSTIAAHGQTVVPAPISVVPVSLSALGQALLAQSLSRANVHQPVGQFRSRSATS